MQELQELDEPRALRDLRDDIDRVLVTEDDIRDAVVRLGRQLTGDYEGKELLLVGVL